jgi:beta-N-acetylhexosaminidase
LVDVSTVADVVGSPESDSIAQMISDNTVTLLRNKGGLIPLHQPVKIHIVTLTNEYNSQVGEELQRTLGVRHSRTSLARLFDGSGPEEIRTAMDTGSASDVIVLAVYLSIGSWKGKLGSSSSLTGFLEGVSKLRKPVISVAFGDPYVLGRMPDTDAVLTSYAGGRRAERSVALALSGDIDINARLPVTIPGKYAIGEGLVLQAHETSTDH